jgi:hypothetical protein
VTLARGLVRDHADEPRRTAACIIGGRTSKRIERVDDFDGVARDVRKSPSSDVGSSRREDSQARTLR